jgi:hypothetical protein
MPISVRLSNEIVNAEKTVGAVMHRSGASQIEFWAEIGKIAEENPELPYSFIKETLLAKAEMDNGMLSDYEFDN